MVRGFVFGAVLTAVLFGAGCGGPRLAAVSGRIDYGEKPLADGEIYFVGEGTPPEILPIKDGKYSGKVTTGKKKIEIYAFKEDKVQAKGGYKPETESGAPRVNYIPPLYNVNSQTIVEVKSGESNEFSYVVSK